MARALFFVYFIAIGASLGVALFGVVLYIKLSNRRSGLRRLGARFAAVAMIGHSGLSGVLLHAILPARQIPPTLDAWLFLAALTFILVGYMGLVRTAILAIAAGDAERELAKQRDAAPDEEVTPS